MKLNFVAASSRTAARHAVDDDAAKLYAVILRSTSSCNFAGCDLLLFIRRSTLSASGFLPRTIVLFAGVCTFGVNVPGWITHLT